MSDITTMTNKTSRVIFHASVGVGQVTLRSSPTVSTPETLEFLNNVQLFLFRRHKTLLAYVQNAAQNRRR